MRIDRNLVRRVEHSAAGLAMLQAAALATLAPASEAAAEPLDSGALVAFGRGRYVNRAIGVGLGDTPVPELVDTVTRFYADRGMPPSLEVCPWIDRALLTELDNGGYRLERFRNVYARDLHDLPAEGSAQLVPLDAATSGDRSRILAGDAPVGSDARRVSDEFCSAMSLIHDNVDLVALDDGVAVACGSLTIVDAVGWLGGAATGTAHRGHGLQSALVARRLRVARELGCTLAAATALPDGQSARNLERLGFTLLYTQAVLTRG